MDRRIMASLAVVFAAIAGCKQEKPAPSSAPASAQVHSLAPGAWIKVPPPAFKGIDSITQEQLLAEKRKIETAVLTLSDPAELGLTFGNAGVIFHAHQIVGTAEACYKNARIGRPWDYRWAYYLGRLYMDYGALAEAMLPLQEALTMKPDDIPTLLALGEADLVRSQPQQSLPLFERALAADPSCAAVWFALGRAHLAMNDEPTAIEQLETARILSPEATGIHDMLARAFGVLGDLARAAECAAAIGSQYPVVPDPLMQEVSAHRNGKARLEALGGRAFVEKRYADAVDFFRTVIDLNSYDPHAYFNLAATLAMRDEPQGSIDAYRRALELDPQYAPAHFGLGVLLARLGRDAEAVEHYTAAARTDPSMAGVRLNLANALNRLHRFAEAEKQYAGVVAMEPENVDAQYLEAVTLGRLGRYGEARGLLEKSLASRPTAPLLLHALARLLATAPDKDVYDPARALPLAKAEFEANHDLDHLATLAMAYAALGNWPDAIQTQQRFLAAARTFQRDDLVELAQSDLADYEKHRPRRIPWRTDDPLSYPTPAAPGGPIALSPAAGAAGRAAPTARRTVLPSATAPSVKK